MKKIILQISVLLSTFIGYSQNPICPIGTYIADPTARVWSDGKLYIYGSTDESPTYWCSYNHDVLYTADLKKWDLKQNVFSSKGESDAVKETDALLFAPDAMYHDGLFYLYFCTPDKKYSEGVAVAKSPLGPFLDAKKLNTTKYNEIDPTVFVDDDGQIYYYWGQSNLKGAKLKSNMTELDETSIQENLLNTNEHYFHEGSFVFKRNNIYYVLYAHEGRRDCRPTSLGYATSNSPLGPFSYKGVVIDNFGCDPETWNNHGSIAEFKNQWYVFYHRSSQGSKIMRRACVEPIHFNIDGTIEEVEMTSQGAGNPLDAFSKIEAERACLLNGYCRINLVETNNEAVCSIKNGDEAVYKYIDFGSGVSLFKAKIHSYNGGTINLRIGSPTGNIIGSLEINPLNKLRKYETFSCKIDTIEGVHALFLEFVGAEKGSMLFDLDSFQFE